MFKFTYQAFVLLSLAWSYALARAAALSISLRKTGAKRKWPVNVVCFAAHRFAVTGYRFRPPGSGFILQIKSICRIGRPGNKWRPKTARKLPVINRMNWPLTMPPSMVQRACDRTTGCLEAAGKSYTDFGRISAFTGLPTVMGWKRISGSGEQAVDPEAYSQSGLATPADVRQIYTTSDQGERQSLLEKYHVEYIVLGNLERSEYSQEDEDGVHTCLVQEELLVQSGTIVFQKGRLVVIKVNRPTQAYG